MTIESGYRGVAMRLAHDAGGAAIRIVPLAVTGIFLLIAGTLLVKGGGSLSLDFVVSNPRSSGRAGGVASILVSTALIMATCMAVVVPVGLATAIYLVEQARHRARTRRTIRMSLTILAGVPSIVFGLFGNYFFSHFLGLGFSILSGGLTLACMVLPLFISATVDVLKGVPDSLRDGAAALGMTQWRSVSAIVLPVALPGLVSAFLLSLGRAVGETAALLFTSGYVDRMPGSLLDSGRTLSIHIYDLAMNVAGGDSMAHASALLLIGILFAIGGLLGLTIRLSPAHRGLTQC